MSKDKLIEAVELFPARIKGRVVPAKELNPNVTRVTGSAGGWDSQKDVAYIPVANNAFARTVRLHEATHAIYSKPKDKIDMIDQALEDVKIHKIWLEDLTGPPRRDEIAFALANLRQSKAVLNRFMKSLEYLREGKPIPAAMRMSAALVMTRSAAILSRDLEIKKRSETLLKICAAYLGPTTIKYILECIDAVAKDDILLARKLFAKYALVTDDKPPGKDSSGATPTDGVGRGGGKSKDSSGSMAKYIKGYLKKKYPGDKYEEKPKPRVPEDYGGAKEAPTAPEPNREEPTPELHASNPEEPTAGDEQKSSPDDNGDIKTELPEVKESKAPDPKTIADPLPEDGEIKAKLAVITESELKAALEAVSPLDKEKEAEAKHDNALKDPEDSVVIIVIPDTPEKHEVKSCHIGIKPAPMYIHNLSLDVSRRVSGTGGNEQAPTTSGMKIRASRLTFAALNSNTKLFTKKTVGGTVLIDASGSMDLEDSQLYDIALKVQSGRVAYYSGTCDWDVGSEGHLVVYAYGGKIRSNRLTLPFRCGGNLVDYAALQWLLKQPPPRFWVCDGRVSGVTGTMAKNLALRAREDKRIVHVETLDELNLAIKGVKVIPPDIRPF